MVKKMKFRNILSFCTILIIIFINSVNLQNISTLSISICEVIEKFYTRYSRNVDIIDFRGYQGDLVGKIMKNLNNSITLTIIKAKDIRNWDEILENQSILIFNHFIDLHMFNKKDLFRMRYINPIRFLVYCQDATALLVSRIKTDLVIPPYYYFIIFDKSDEKFKLYTFENRNDLEICHEIQQLIQINEFSQETFKWTKNPIFPKKYRNFHNCIMVLGIQGGSNFFRMSSSRVSNALGEAPITKIFLEIADLLNFEILASVCFFKGCLEETEKEIYLYNIINTETLDGFAVNMNENRSWLSVLLNIECT